MKPLKRLDPTWWCKTPSGYDQQDGRARLTRLKTKATVTGWALYIDDEFRGSWPTLRQAKEEAAAAPPPTQQAIPSGYGLAMGEIVMVGHGGPAKLVRIFDNDDKNEMVHGKVNVLFPRANGPVTVDAMQIRRAMPDEVEAYRMAGGRL